METTVLTIESRDGTRIACHRSGGGPPLVLVHGTTADHTRWLPVLPALEERFTVHAMDRRGRGDSGDDGGEYAIEREFEDVAALVEAIGEPVGLLGHSYGALCSLEAALLTDKVARLIIYEPPIPVGVEIYPPGSIERMEKQLAEGDNEGTLTTFMTEVVRVPPQELELLRSLPVWQVRVAAAGTIPRECHAELSYTFDPSRFAGLTLPTLILQGSDSPPFLVEACRRANDAVPGSRIAVMEGQQHTAMDTGPDVFLNAVLGFLEAR